MVVVKSRVADSTGYTGAALPIPNDYSLLGVQYFTQWVSFGRMLRSSNGTRNVIGD